MWNYLFLDQKVWFKYAGSHQSVFTGNFFLSFRRHSFLNGGIMWKFQNYPARYLAALQATDLFTQGRVKQCFLGSGRGLQIRQFWKVIRRAVSFSSFLFSQNVSGIHRTVIIMMIHKDPEWRLLWMKGSLVETKDQTLHQNHIFSSYKEILYPLIATSSFSCTVGILLCW